jgi:hypothetical protein
MSKPVTKTLGAELLAVFLNSHGITFVAAGDALDVSAVAVLTWTDFSKRPKEHLRRVIAKWTNGFVPVDSWLTNEELQRIGNVIPFVAVPRTQPTKLVA